MHAKLLTVILASLQKPLYVGSCPTPSLPRAPGRPRPAPQDGLRRRPAPGGQDHARPPHPGRRGRVPELGRPRAPGAHPAPASCRRHRSGSSTRSTSTGSGGTTSRASTTAGGSGQQILVTGSARLDFYRYSAATRSRAATTCCACTRCRRRSSGCDSRGRAPRPAAPGRLPGAVLRRLGGRGAPLVARVPQPARPRGAGRAWSGSRTSARLELLMHAAAGAGRLAAVDQRAARGPAGQPQDGRELARRSWSGSTPSSGCRRSARRGSARSRRSRSTTTSTGRLVPDDGAALREPRRLATCSSGSTSSRTPRAATSSCATSATSDGREVDFVVVEGRTSAAARRVQVGRRRGRPQPALPASALPGRRGLAGLGDGHEGLPDAGGHPRRARACGCWSASCELFLGHSRHRGPERSQEPFHLVRAPDGDPEVLPGGAGNLRPTLTPSSRRAAITAVTSGGGRSSRSRLAGHQRSAEPFPPASCSKRVPG